MHVTQHTQCRVCGSDLFKAIRLGEQYLQGSFVKEGVQSLTRRVPMDLYRCNPAIDEAACGLLQARYTVPPELMYETYWYHSGTNASMKNHLAQIARDARQVWRGVNVGNTEREEGVSVLDIGCNDGTLLDCFDRAFDKVGFKVGIDPSNVTADYMARTESDGMKYIVINDFYPSDRLDFSLGVRNALLVDKPFCGFDVVSAIAMIYDLPNPLLFFEEVEKHLAPNGIFVFEMSYLPRMLANLSYDSICHEHLEYYSLATIENVLKQVGLKVIHVSESDMNGGSVRCFAVHVGVQVVPDQSVKKMRHMEFNLKLDTDEPYNDFMTRAEKHKKELREVLSDLRTSGKRVHVYGASTKGNTLLQWCEITTDLVEAAADRNPDKWGAFTPGTMIPIISEDASRARKPDYYLVLPWHFRDEFLHRERQVMRDGTKMIFPLPKIEIVDQPF